jgi:hypothetical protein
MAFLNPQDCLTNPLTKQPFISPPMKKLKDHPKSPPPNRSNRSPQQPNRRKNRPDNNSDNNKQNSTPPSRAAAVLNKVNTKSLVIGQVKILKRGEDISVKTAPLKGFEATVKPDLGSTKLLGPDPESVPTQIRLGNDSMKKSTDSNRVASIRLSNQSVKSITNVNLVAPGFYAGSAFNVNSPPPSSLPLPAFFTKKLVKVKKAVAVDDVASSLLKKVLRVDL